jgi:hypothetical protein
MNDDESEDNCDIADGHDVARTKRRPPPGVAAFCTLLIISERGLIITVYLLDDEATLLLRRCLGVSTSFCCSAFWLAQKKISVATPSLQVHYGLVSHQSPLAPDQAKPTDT